MSESSPVMPKSNLAQPESRTEADGAVPILKRLRLTDQISEAIRQQIFSGELRAGDRVVEQKIAKQFGVGQNPVREALIELSHMGFVRRVPNRGTYITRIGASDAKKIARLRGLLENLAVQLIADRFEQVPLDLTEAESYLSVMRKAAEGGDIRQFFEHDILFHRTLWKLADDEYLEQLLEQLVIPLFAFFIIENLHPAGLLDAVSYHEKVIEDLKNSRPDDAKKAMSDLLQLSQKQQQEILPGDVKEERRG